MLAWVKRMIILISNRIGFREKNIMELMKAI